jgi:hypothetical protein
MSNSSDESSATATSKPQPTFVDFLNFIINKREDEETDWASVVDFYVNFIEPFTSENEIELPDEFAEILDALYESEEDDEDDEEEEDEEDDEEEEAS